MLTKDNKNTLDSEVNKILINAPPYIGQGMSIEDQKEIDKIMMLVKKKAEKCEYFKDSTELIRFRIEFYKNKELSERIPVIGDFLKFTKRDGPDADWYWMKGLGRKVYKIYEKYLFD